jgi:hypothetical protein
MGCCCTVARTAVSKKKKRLVADGPKDGAPEGGINLDLTQVHPNIICMGFPASGFESWYRNPYEDVVHYLDYAYPNRYLVFNLCSETKHQYDPEKYFHGSVNNRYRFKDMTPCPLWMIPAFVEEAVKFIRKPTDRRKVRFQVAEKNGKGSAGSNEPISDAAEHRDEEMKKMNSDSFKNEASDLSTQSSNPAGMDGAPPTPLENTEKVVAIHCKAGKGRTGLMACCLWLALGSTSDGLGRSNVLDPNWVVQQYGIARTKDGKGLTHRSQIRYVQYYAELLSRFEGKLPQNIPTIRLSTIELTQLVKALGNSIEFISLSSPTTDPRFQDLCIPVAAAAWLTAPNAEETKSADDGCDTLIFDLTSIRVESLQLPENESGSSNSPAFTDEELQAWFARLQGDIRVELLAKPGHKWIGALQVHTLFIQSFYDYRQIDSLYKSKKLQDSAGIRLGYTSSWSR